MKARIPSKIKVGAHTYSIELDPYLIGDRNRYGEVCHRTERITIGSSEPVALRNQTLLHEVLHIGETFYRINISDDDIDRIAETILQFLDSMGIEFDWADIK